MDILSPEQYLINKAKAAQGRDAYEAKAWIITAQTLFPHNFFVQLETYLIEKFVGHVQLALLQPLLTTCLSQERNLEAAARSFSYIVLKFQNQPLLWTEISKLTAALRLPESGGGTEEQDFYLKMFQHISYEVQHKILLLTANHMENSLDHCRLILLLMKRFPQAIPQHARCLLESLISGIGSSTSNSGCPYREMLINDALPLILIQKPPELPTNLLNLIVGICIEHYVEQIYRRSDDDKYVTECWRKVYETLEVCGRLLKWEKFVLYSRSYGKDIYWTRLMQIVAASPSGRAMAESKQIFYTSLVVFITSLQEYMRNVNRKEKTEGNAATGTMSTTTRLEFVLVEALREPPPPTPMLQRRHSDTFNQDTIKIVVGEPCRPETPNCLITAAHCWQLMNSNELLQIESNQLLVRLPIGDWVSRFISDLAVYLGRPDDFQAILNTTASVRDGLEKDVKLLSLAVLQNNWGTQTVGPLILSIAKELAQSYSSTEIPQGEYLKELTVAGGGLGVAGRQLILLPMTKRAILQYCVRILVAKLEARLPNLMPGPSNTVLGYLLVLLQLDWPNGMALALLVFKLISAKRSFTFLPFSKYIILTDFIEEFSYMWSPQGGEVTLELASSTKTRNYGTRRADKGVKEDFKQIMREQIVRSYEDMDFLIIKFILQEHKTLFHEMLL